MERIKSLTRYQKVLLLAMAAMVLAFSILYSFTIAQKGFAYNDVILTPSQDNGSTVYSGKIRGEQARFTVSADKTVEFRYGDQTYGPYTAREDPTAIPEDTELRGLMTGVELSCGEEILFRGGVLNLDDELLLYNEDGSLENTGIYAITSNGVQIDGSGNEIDPMEPTASTILYLMANPPLTHKGTWIGLVGGIFLCIVAAVSILFADELFRWSLSFRITDPERAEPSDWEIITRYVSWTVLVLGALVVFIVGLQ